jgi:hypothetical protein
MRVIILFLSITYASLVSANNIFHGVFDFPPYWSYQVDHFEGYHVLLCERIYKEANIKINFTKVPYARIQRLNLNKNIGVIAYGEDSKSMDRLLFPIPKTKLNLNIYSFKKILPSTIKALSGKKVVIARGFPLVNFEAIRSDKTVLLTQVNTLEQAIKFLSRGRAQYLISLEDPFENKFNQKNHFKKLHKKTLTSLSGWPIVIVKSHPKSRILYKKIKAAYESLLAKKVITYKNEKLLLTKGVQ